MDIECVWFWEEVGSRKLNQVWMTYEEKVSWEELKKRLGF